MDLVENKCIDLFKQIHWEEVGKGEDYDYYFLLLIEFFRRATIFSNNHNIICNSPWQVISAVMPEGCSLSDEAKENIENISSKNPHLRIYVPMTLLAFTLFEKAKDLGIISSHEINVFSPLIKIFESKGTFHSHHGFIEFNDLSQTSIRNREWVTTNNDSHVKFDEYF